MAYLFDYLYMNKYIYLFFVGVQREDPYYMFLPLRPPKFRCISEKVETNKYIQKILIKMTHERHTLCGMVPDPFNDSTQSFYYVRRSLRLIPSSWKVLCHSVEFFTHFWIVTLILFNEKCKL